MSEQRPLLGSQPGRQTWRSKTAHLLESRVMHKTVISLIVIDATCVLADLIYTFLSPSCTPTDSAPMWLEFLARLSLAITSLFLLEIPVAIWAFGPRYYIPCKGVTHASFHLFDAVIIIITVVLEAVLKGREQQVGGLLIVFRLWRLIKLVGGVAVGTGEIGEEEARELAEIGEELEKTRAELSKALDENLVLRRRLAFENPS